MAEYYSKEQLLECTKTAWQYDMYDLEDFLEEVPTADVVEMKHGEWKHECVECSVCKRNISEICDADSYLTSGIEYELLFCPFCGAKMDGRRTE